VYQATKDEATIRRWWTLEPSAGVAIATGPISNGLVVLDADGTIGLDNAEDLELFDIRTPTVITLRGRHWYFHSTEITRSSSGRLGKKIDVQAKGSYVCAPPTTINDRRYRWRRAPSVECAELPADLVAKLRRPATPRELPTPDAVSQPSDFGRETASGWGDRSRSGLDAQRVMEMVRAGATQRDVFDWFETHSEKFMGRASRDLRGAEEYRRRTYSWALKLVTHNIEKGRIIGSSLEVLGSSHDRSELFRVRLDVALIEDGEVLDVKVAVPTEEHHNVKMWTSIAPDLDPLRVADPGGYQLVRALVGRRVDVVRRGARVVWMSIPRNLNNRSSGKT